MPKKTKKKKLLALYHKKIRLLENKQTATSAAIPTSPSYVPKSITNQKLKIETAPSTLEEKQLNLYFFSDLKKSLILISLIIGLEISLYFAKLIR